MNVLKGLAMSAARAMRRLSLPLAALLLAAAPAHAVFVVGVWDPAYGSQWPSYGWRGQITLDVPADCSAPPQGTRFIATPGCSTPWTVVSASVEFYALADVATTLETLDFTAALNGTVDQLQIGPSPDYAVIGFSTVDPTPTLARSRQSTLLGGDYFALDFQLIIDESTPQGRTTARLFGTSNIDGINDNIELNGFEYKNGVDPVVDVSEAAAALPLPSSVWLGALALVALGAVTARSRRRG